MHVHDSDQLKTFLMFLSENAGASATISCLIDTRENIPRGAGRNGTMVSPSTVIQK